MKKLLVVLDDETANLLAKDKNKSATVREAIKYIKLDITTDKLENIAMSYKALMRVVTELDEKIDYIAEKVQ